MDNFLQNLDNYRQHRYGTEVTYIKVRSNFMYRSYMSQFPSSQYNSPPEALVE